MTTTGIQIVIDAADGHALATFWAAATGYLDEDRPGVAAPSRRSRRRAQRRAGRRILLQEVPEPTTVHLDLIVGPEARAAAAERLTGLGASVLRDVQERAQQFTVMADPGGNEFCVA